MSLFPEMRRGFTLIELLIVIAVVAILSAVVLLVLNPVQLLKQSRDSNRLSELGLLNATLARFATDQGGANMGSSSVVYVSLPDTTSTCANLGLPGLPASWSYHCASTSTLRKVDGTGWIPVNLSQASFGAQLGALPVDALNTTSSGGYYTYITSGGKWVLSSFLESDKYSFGGSADKVSTDGGVNPGRVELGTDLSLDPTGLPITSGLRLWLRADSLSLSDGDPVGAWTDLSSYGDHATSTGSARPLYRANVLNGKPVIRFDGVDDFLRLNSSIDTGGISFFIVAKWNAFNLYSFAVGLDSGTAGYLRNIDTNPSGVFVHPDSDIYTVIYEDGIARTWGGCGQACFNNVAASSTHIYAMPSNSGIGKGIRYFGQNETNNQSWWSGDIAEVAVYNRSLSASERRAVEKYLGDKYGIAVQ